MPSVILLEHKNYSIMKAITTYRTPNTLKNRYDQYRHLFNDGSGNDERTGQPLMTFEEWLENS